MLQTARLGRRPCSPARWPGPCSGPPARWCSRAGVELRARQQQGLRLARLHLRASSLPTAGNARSPPARRRARSSPSGGGCRPPGGSGVAAVMPAISSALQFADAEVRRLVDRADRQVGRDLVQVVARRVALLLQLAIVVAEADDRPRSLRRRVEVRCPFAQRVLDARRCRCTPVRRRQQVGDDRLQADQTTVAVRVDEAGQHRRAAEILDDRRRPLVRLDLRARADREDRARP